jgi:phage gp36-like protein
MAAELLTGYYINENDLLTCISQDELTAITVVIDETAKTTNVTELIKKICAMVDTKIQSFYDIPLDPSFDITPLKDAIARIVVYGLSGLYSSLSDNVLKIRDSQNKDALSYIEGIASGDIKLISTSNVKEADKYYFDSLVRIDRTFR